MPDAHSPIRAFDGVVCIGGEDWWYHNRGHFDFQIMRRMARSWPVLFVNSLGVRMPSPAHDRQFAARIWRKAKSLGRGLVEAEPGFWVYSPLTAPGALGQRLSGPLLAPQIRLAARRAGIRRPLLWIHCPAGARLAGRLGSVATVMQRTDKFEAFPEADPALVGAQIRHLKQAADLVVYAAPHLMAEEAGEVRRGVLVTHGVDVERFAAAGRGSAPEPADVAGLPRPRVGFIGGIDAHTFDPGLFTAVAGVMPDVHFVMVGGCSLSEGWCALPNVSLLGRKPYNSVAGYMAACDALIMPWNKSPWIEACNPIKLKEYLAVGRPVVSTGFPALAPWRDLMHVADDAPAFASAIRRALAAPADQAVALARLAGESWDDKAALLQQAILDLGLVFERGGIRPRAGAATIVQSLCKRPAQLFPRAP